VATGQEDAARLRNSKASSPRRQAPRDTSDRAIDLVNLDGALCPQQPSLRHGFSTRR
jgi:hypothetical protein